MKLEKFDLSVFADYLKQLSMMGSQAYLKFDTQRNQLSGFTISENLSVFKVFKTPLNSMCEKVVTPDEQNTPIYMYLYDIGLFVKNFSVFSNKNNTEITIAQVDGVASTFTIKGCGGSNQNELTVICVCSNKESMYRLDNAMDVFENPNITNFIESSYQDGFILEETEISDIRGIISKLGKNIVNNSDSLKFTIDTEQNTITVSDSIFKVVLQNKTTQTGAPLSVDSFTVGKSDFTRLSCYNYRVIVKKSFVEFLTFEIPQNAQVETTTKKQKDAVYYSKMGLVNNNLDQQLNNLQGSDFGGGDFGISDNDLMEYGL